MAEQKRPGSSDQITRNYFDSLLLEMRHLDGKKPDTTFQIYGKTFSTPITTAALSHLNKLHEKGMVELARGAFLADALSFSGMGDEEEFQGMCETGAQNVKIIKPYADRELILHKMEAAKKSGALAVGMDIDHSFSGNGEYDKVLGYDMCPVSLEEMKEFVKAAEIPFVVKGVLSERDAYKCLEAGAKGIVVSHHHGIMDFAVPPLKILPSIAKVVAGEIPIFVDCCVESGMDVFKALALGATAVSVGRALMDPLSKGGAEMVAEKIGQMNAELKGAMARTGCYDLAHMDPTVIWQ